MTAIVDAIAPDIVDISRALMPASAASGAAVASPKERWFGKA